MNVDNRCSCGETMSVEPNKDAVRLSCRCGNHRTINFQLLKNKGPSDTQPFTPVPKPKAMTREEIREARQRLSDPVMDALFAESRK